MILDKTLFLKFPPFSQCVTVCLKNALCDGRYFNIFNLLNADKGQYNFAVAQSLLVTIRLKLLKARKNTSVSIFSPSILNIGSKYFTPTSRNSLLRH